MERSYLESQVAQKNRLLYHKVAPNYGLLPRPPNVSRFGGIQGFLERVVEWSWWPSGHFVGPDIEGRGRHCAEGILTGGVEPKHGYLPGPPNVPLLKALWSLLDGIWGSLKGSWGVLV